MAADARLDGAFPGAFAARSVGSSVGHATDPGVRAGYFVAHNHALASWSAVYCVKDGNGPAGTPRGGLLRLFDTRAGADAYPDPANQRLRQPFVVGDLDLRLRAGQLVVFPSYLFHEVTPYYGSDIRITVASNCWFAA